MLEGDHANSLPKILSVYAAERRVANCFTSLKQAIGKTSRSYSVKTDVENKPEYVLDIVHCLRAVFDR